MRQLCIPAVILILTSMSACVDKEEPLSFEVIHTSLSDSSCSDCKTSVVYVKNFSGNDKNWETLEQFGIQNHDTTIALESFYFIHDSSNISPGQITLKQYNEIYSKFEIAQHAIIEGVSSFRQDSRSGLRGF